MVTQFKPKHEPTGLRGGLSLRDVLIEACETEEVIQKELKAIEEAQATVKEWKGGISEHLLQVAKERSYHKDADAFLAACKAEEKWLKSPEAGKWQRSKMPRAWTQAKSNISQAMKAGFDVSDYDTESALRHDLNEYRKAKRGEGTQKADKVPSVGKLAESERFQELVQHLEAFTAKLATLTDDKDIEAATAIVDAANERLKKEVLSKLVPEEPKAPKGKKKATAKAKAGTA